MKQLLMNLARYARNNSVLELLSRHDEYKVDVVANVATTQVTLESLCYDSSKDVREAVVERLEREAKNLIRLEGP